MAQQIFTASWLGVYKSNVYSGDTSVRGGSVNSYASYLGIPTAVREALESSETTPTLYLRLNIITGAGVRPELAGHKETYNKANGIQPSYTRLTTLPAFVDGTQDLNLSSFKTGYMNGTYQGIVLYASTNTADTLFAANGVIAGANKPSFVVNGTWNVPPNTPGEFTSPVSSTRVNETLEITWGAGSDAEDSATSLSYELGYYDGSQWSEYWTVGAGVTNYTYSTANKPDTSLAQVSVRTIDTNGAKSDWVYSSNFLVDHDTKPEKPTNLTPTGGKVINRSSPLRVTWRHNDNDLQAGYRISWRTVGSDGTKGALNYIPSSTDWVSSIDEYHDFPANTFPLNEIEWNVSTKDQEGLNSDPSSYERFYAGTLSDAPVWTYPASGTIINSSRITVHWSSIDQARYELVLLSSTGITLWNETKIAENKSTLLGYNLEDRKSYTLQLRVFSQISGLWSNWSNVSFTTEFVVPNQPLLEIQTKSDNGEPLDTITLRWTNPSTGGVIANSVQVYRREYGSQTWGTIATSKAPNSSMIDYTPASGVVYQYMVRAWNTNNTFADSKTEEGSVQLIRSFLHKAKTPTDLLVLDVSERSEEVNLNGSLMLFANRKNPVYEYSIHEQMSVPISFYISTASELRAVTNFLKSKETFLYRDNTGRRIYCVANAFSIKDLPVSGFEVSLTLEEVNYEGGI